MLGCFRAETVRRRGRRGAIRHRGVAELLRRALVAAGPILGVLGWGAATAGTLDGFVELSRASADQTQGVRGGPDRNVQNVVLVRRYNVAATQQLFPNLRIRLGALLQKGTTEQDTGDGPIESTFTRLRPSFEVRLVTQTIQADASFSSSRDENEGANRSFFRSLRKTYSTGFNWIPEQALHLRFQFVHSDAYSGDRTQQDISSERYLLGLDYTPITKLFLNYQTTWSEVLDRPRDTRSQARYQSGRVSYADSWWDGRVSFNSDYAAANRRDQTISPGGGEVALPLFPLAGLSSLDDTPDRGPLDPNPALVNADPNLAASAGINLGMPPSNGELRPRNMGMDFGDATRVNTFDVFIEREIPTEIADQLGSWEIFTSDDNDQWIRKATVPRAEYVGFLRRFELKFADVSARYVKVVVRPLPEDPLVASEYREVFVTELQAFDRRPSSEVVGVRETSSQQLSVNTRVQVLQSPMLSYDFSYSASDTSSAASIYSLINGLSLQQALNEVYSVNARLAHEDSRTRSGDLTANLFSAGLTASPVEKLRCIVSFSGRAEEEDGRKTDVAAVVANAVAELYRGIDVSLGLNRSAVREASESQTDNTGFNLSATVTPHPAVTVNLLYQDGRDDVLRQGLRTRSKALSNEVGVAWRPVVTLYIFASSRREERTGEIARDTRTYNLGWSPLPGGNLLFSVGYVEIYRSDVQETDRSLTPNVRWTINPRAYLNVGYQRSSSDSVFLQTEDSIASATLRINF